MAKRQHTYRYTIVALGLAAALLALPVTAAQGASASRSAIALVAFDLWGWVERWVDEASGPGTGKMSPETGAVDVQRGSPHDPELDEVGASAEPNG